jgi:hypothetical protein
LIKRVSKKSNLSKRVYADPIKTEKKPDLDPKINKNKNKTLFVKK